MSNKKSNLDSAKALKYDEFYTTYEDIEKEMQHYTQFFKDKRIYCNCDNPLKSNFWKYFHTNFEKLGLFSLSATFIAEKPYKALYLGENDSDILSFIKTPILSGDFRYRENINIIASSDIIITNPPFSLFKEFLPLLLQQNKKFIVLGNMNALTYKEIFPYIKQNKLWVGYTVGDMSFQVPTDSEEKSCRYWVDEQGQHWRSLGNIIWFTNIDIVKRHTPLELSLDYDPKIHATYRNFNAINVNKLKEIPKNYSGVMGVPITFLTKYNPDQFEIIGHDHDLTGDGGDGVSQFEYVDNQGNVVGVYKRILIKNKVVN